MIPLVQLSQGIGALAKGDFDRGKALVATPVAYAELTALATDFQQMSDALALRQAALQESEKRYRSLFEQVPVSLFRTAPDGQCLDVNPANVQMLGYPDQDSLLQINVKDLYVEPEDRRSWLDIALRNQAVNNFEVRLRRFDGSIIWVRLTCRIIRDGEGKILHYEGCAEDITERKQAEASVRKLSQAVEQSPVSIVITDTFGKIEFVNTKFTQVTGYSSEDVIGRNPKILASGQTARETYRHLWKTIRSGNVWRGEFSNRKKNGDIFLEHATIAAVKNAEGIITHFVAVKEDITERNKLEEQLRQTQKMESVGQLAGGVAHDFNNMLGVILGHAELALNRTGSDDPRRQNLEAIQAAGLRSVEITRQLLAFARKQTIMPKILDLNSTVDGMLKLLRRLIGEDIDLRWLPETNLWPIKMDPSQIDQILANLCVNARDAIAGVGKITIETHNIVLDEAYCKQHVGFLPGGFVMLTVSDDGSGMDKETLNKIFEPFFTTKGLGKGTGLGLATIYGIIKQNLGFINVYSELGHGSVFNIYLPRAIAKTEKTFMEEEKTKSRPPLGNETILLVEDDAAVLEMVKDVLLDLGYNVLPAASPKEALRQASDAAGKIDMIITDLVMPEMTGRELAKQLIALYPHLRCLYMSGYTSNVIAHQSVLEEGVNFIQKPFSQQDLAVKLRIVLGKDSKGV